MTQPMLQVNNVSKAFGERQAVSGVSFSLTRGQTLGLIGPNGAGKSTTVSMVCGLLRPDAGQVLLDGVAIGQGNSAVKRQLGLVPQDLALFEDLSARENLKIFGALYGLRGSQLKSRCDEVLALVNLGDRAGDMTGTFSGGMKRRLNIAAALLHDPQLLILDEPTVGVDPQSRNAIFDSLETLKKQGRSLIYTSHYMEEVERLADHIVVIDHGKVIADESPAALYLRLPATAALHIDLQTAISQETLLLLKTRPGVGSVVCAAKSLDIALLRTEDALAVLEWLRTQGCQPVYFATAKARLEEVFLTLTGRTLRD
jgi:ABC-2 type transport system ATP-binding protein